MKYKGSSNTSKPKALKTYILIVLFIIFILILSDNKVMAKYELVQSKSVSIDVLIDEEMPILEIIDEEGNYINNDNNETTSSVEIKKISDNLSGIKSATYKYNAEAEDFSNAKSNILEKEMIFNNIGYYEIIVKDNAENTLKVVFHIMEKENTSTEFITEWTLTTDNTTITLPIISDIPNITIDWGDGAKEDINKLEPSHKYLNKGIYDIIITGYLPSWNALDCSSNGANSRKYITGVKQWGEVGLENMKGAFAFCQNLTFIAEPTVNSFKDVTSFEMAFYSCDGLTNIPNKLFKNCNKVNSFKQTFMLATKLKSIPTGLFDDCINVTTFLATFNGCIELTGEIPKGLFNNCSDVTSFGSTFTSCKGLTSIPADLFSNCSKASGFSATFSNCSGLAEVPEGLFDNISNCNNNTFTYTFMGCTGLTKTYINSKYIDSRMFEGCNNLTDIIIGNNVSTIRSGAFYTDSNLKTTLITNNEIAKKYRWDLDNRDISMSEF